MNAKKDNWHLDKFWMVLTVNGPGHFRIHSKIWCLNFIPQYLLNYSCPTNDSWRVRKKTIRALILIFGLLGWLRTLRENFARLLSLIAFRDVSTHARVTLTQSWYQWDKRARNENRKTENLRSIFFWLFDPIFMISETSCQYSVKWHAMLCKIICKSYSRVFSTIRSAGAFRSSQNLTGTKSYHGPFRVKIGKLFVSSRSDIFTR